LVSGELTRTLPTVVDMDVHLDTEVLRGALDRQAAGLGRLG
jgi:hypothetical protein